MGEMTMNTYRASHRRGRRRIIIRLALGLIALGVVGWGAYASVALAGRPFGNRIRELPVESLQPGDPKREAILQEEATIERLRGKIPPSAAGSRAESWDPDVKSGIDDSGESPYPGREGLVIINAWHSGLTGAGKLTHVYVGLEDGTGLVVFAVSDLESGLEEVHSEYALPGGSGTPRITTARGSVVEIQTSTGLVFEFDLQRRVLSPAGRR
jgi:hypothetical protein